MDADGKFDETKKFSLTSRSNAPLAEEAVLGEDSLDVLEGDGKFGETKMVSLTAEVKATGSFW